MSLLRVLRLRILQKKIGFCLEAFLAIFLVVLLSCELFCSQSWGLVLSLPASLSEELLSESVPSAFSPNEMDVSDFTVHWASQPIPDAEFQLMPGSLQWVRVLEVLVLPRARLRIRLHRIESGQVMNSNFSQAIQVQNGEGEAEIPIGLISGEKNPIDITVKKGGQIYKGQLQIQLNPLVPQSEFENRIYIDSSCSPYHLQIKTQAFQQNRSIQDWIYVGCRQVRVFTTDYRTSSLEVFVFWDNVGQKIQVGDVDTPSPSSSLWPLRLRPEPAHIQLKSREREIDIQYGTPQILNSASIAMGLGPYRYYFEGGGERYNFGVPMVTLYGSYFITEAIRIVTFGATTINSQNYLDFGLYVRFEQFRFIDKRLGINLLIGGHAVGFTSFNGYYVVAALPQGFELNYSDAFARGKTLTIGAFIYPPIGSNAYYNLWLRWGGSIFAELNYIAWQAQPSDVSYRASSAGITVGFPLARFW